MKPRETKRQDMIRRETSRDTGRWNTVAIVGVGLIGGSIGLALRQRRMAGKVVGVGRNADRLKRAEEVGAVDVTTQDLAEGARQAELVVVCTPVERIVDTVLAAASECREGTLITDAGSTKRLITRALQGKLPAGVRFVGSHPIAGSEKSGAEHARADLFEGRVAVVTPTRSSVEGDVQQTADLWSGLGASVYLMSPAAHDRALATTSHAPHVIAAAMARSTGRGDWPLTGGGWKDTTRIAGGDPELWTQILLDNRENVLASLGRFEKSFSAFRAAVERSDRRRLARLLLEAKRHRDAVGN